MKNIPLALAIGLVFFTIITGVIYFIKKLVEYACSIFPIRISTTLKESIFLSLTIIVLYVLWAYVEQNGKKDTLLKK